MEKKEPFSKSYTALISFIVAGAIIAVGGGALYAGANFTGLKSPASPLAIAGAPNRLVIPKIGVDAKIQATGMTVSGRMGIPTNFTDVAWYNLGPKPGEKGSAAIDGHLDTVIDDKAVFARLGELKKGDEIDVVDASGTKIKFQVTAMEVYDDTDAPLGKIFDQSVTTARLNLITCDGTWNQATKNYDKRLVVYSERVLD